MVNLRSGLVLTQAGGLLARLLPLARLGLCPRFSAGGQDMSWISLPDEVGAIMFLLNRKDIVGPVNLTAPQPVTNSAFTAALAAALGRRDRPWLRVPAPALRLALGEASVELLTSTRVIPKRLAQAGYRFRHPALPEALAAELPAAKPGRSPARHRADPRPNRADHRGPARPVAAWPRAHVSRCRTPSPRGRAVLSSAGTRPRDAIAWAPPCGHGADQPGRGRVRGADRLGCGLPIMPSPAYCSSLARESAMSRLRMVSWPMRSTGPNAESSVRSMDSLSGW